MSSTTDSRILSVRWILAHRERGALPLGRLMWRRTLSTAVRMYYTPLTLNKNVNIGSRLKMENQAVSQTGMRGVWDLSEENTYCTFPCFFARMFVAVGKESLF